MVGAPNFLSSTTYRPFTLATRVYDLGEHVRLTQDQHVLGADLDLGAAVLREDDLVTDHDIHGNELTRVVPAARTDSQNLATLRLLPSAVRQHDAADGHLLLLQDLDDQAITKRL
jgi:hypothetical protein